MPGREKFSKKKFHSSIFKKVFDKQKTQTQKPKRNELKTKTFFLQSFYSKTIDIKNKNKKTKAPISIPLITRKPSLFQGHRPCSH